MNLSPTRVRGTGWSAALLLAAAVTLPELLVSTPSLDAQERPKAFRGAEILPITGPSIPEGTLLVHRGRIVAVGSVESVAIPADAVVHDVSGKVIMPGLVDTHSHVGDLDWGDASSPIQGATRILDAVNVRDGGIRRAQAGGITAANMMPGSGHLMSGQTIYVKFRNVTRAEDLLFCGDVLTEICGGMKMANGTNPLRNAPPFPQSRAKSAALVREKFLQAMEYRERIRRAEGDASRMPPRDLELEAIVQVLDGERIVHHHTHRHDDVLTVLRLQEEFGFRVVLQHVSDAWIVADEIARSGFPASLIMVDAPGGKLEAVDLSIRSGAYLERAGAVVGFHTDDWITDSRYFLRQGGLAVRAGMSREGALYGLTMAGAKMMDVEDRIGSLEPGKDADFIVLSGDPLSVYTRVEETWIDGTKVFDLSDPVDRPYAVGGYGLLPRPKPMGTGREDGR
jgi:imidazolonepropionase-like amidohydrolase